MRIVEFVKKIVQQADQLHNKKETERAQQVNQPKETDQKTVEPMETPTDEQFDINNMSITFKDGTMLQATQQQQPFEVQQELELETSLDEAVINDQPPEERVEEHQLPERISQMVAELEEECRVNRAAQEEKSSQKDYDQGDHADVREEE